MKYSADITPEEYAAMEDGYEQGRTEVITQIEIRRSKEQPAQRVYVIGHTPAPEEPGTFHLEEVKDYPDLVDICTQLPGRDRTVVRVNRWHLMEALVWARPSRNA